MSKVGLFFRSLFFILLINSCSSEVGEQSIIPREELPEFNKVDFNESVLIDSINFLLPKYLSRLNKNNDELARFNNLIKEMHVSFYLIDDSLTSEELKLNSTSTLTSGYKLNFESEELLIKEHTIVNGRNTISMEYKGLVNGYPFEKRQLLKWYQVKDKTLLLNIWCRDDQFKDLSNDIRVIQRSVQ